MKLNFLISTWGVGGVGDKAKTEISSQKFKVDEDEDNC